MRAYQNRPTSSRNTAGAKDGRRAPSGDSQRRHPAASIPPSPATHKTCSVPGCERLASEGNGAKYCPSHGRRRSRTGHPDGRQCNRCRRIVTSDEDDDAVHLLAGGWTCFRCLVAEADPEEMDEEVERLCAEVGA